MVVKSSERFREIIKVFTSYGFDYLLDSKNKKSPKNLRKAFEDLGPTFIKIGQILSTRPDLLPKEYIDELSKLQDRAPIEDFEEMKKVFEESLNTTIENTFRKINKVPVASASISQVYDGILKDGRRVVLKIQRPNIYKKMKADISILIRIFRFTNNRIKIPIMDPIEALREIQELTESELNFTIEAENIKRFREYCKNVAPVYAPYVVEELLSNKVIILEKIEGIKINNTDELIKNGYDTKDISNKLVLSYCKQIFEDGFFHGDPHPGNILISGAKICFLDFGIMGNLNDTMKSWLNNTMIAIRTKDKEKMLNCILSIAIKKGKINKIDLYDSISYMFDTYLETSIKNIKIAMLMREVSDIARENNIQLPRELMSLIRGMIIMEGVVSELNPELEIINIIISFIKINKKDTIMNFLNKEELLISIYSFARDSIRIPTRVLEALDKLCAGETKIKLKIVDKDDLLGQINRMVNRLTEGIIISALILSSSLIVSNNVRPLYKGVSVIGITGYIIAFIFAINLLISMFKSCDCRKKDKK